MRRSEVVARLRDSLGGAVRLLARSGMVDVEYYQAQTGRDFADATAAVRHYLDVGADAGHSLHPLFEPDHLRSQRPDDSGEPAVRYLTDPAWSALRPHPLFDLKAATRIVGKPAASQPGGAWLAWVRNASAADPVPLAKPNPPITWGEFRTRLVVAATEWRTGPTPPDPRTDDIRPGLVSIALPVADDLGEALRRRRLLTGVQEVELVYAGCNRRSTYSCLVAGSLGLPISVLRSAERSFAALADAGAALASGSVLVVIAPGTDIAADAVSLLVSRLDDPAVAVVQPLVEDPLMNVHSAGAAYASGDPVPTRLLAGHATADADRMGDREIPAVWSPVFAVRAADFTALGGLDPALDAYAEVDLSLRAREAGLGVPALVTGARATTVTEGRLAEGAALLRERHPVPPDGTAECLAAAGFVSTPDGLRPTRDASGPSPSLRWAIDIAATPGPWGARWGDRHFAESLARSLRRLGQQVAIDHRGASARPSRAYDDVVLTLRGLYPVPAQAGATNLLWVISHPDDVTADELAGYQRVFAAGSRWASERSALWGVEIEPLLQCTDTELFNPGRAEPDSGAPVLFVGNTRNAARPVVHAAVAAGADVVIFGTGWEKTSVAGRVVAQNVPNDEVGALYAGAGVVLNDHWDDMRALGFVSNRLFDAVACGARVLSDAVDGIDELFGQSVQVFADAADVARLLGSVDTAWPDLAARRATATAVSAEHSFDHRAEQLLAAALSVRAGAGRPASRGRADDATS